MTQITLAELPQNLQNLLNQAQKTGEPSPLSKMVSPSPLYPPSRKAKEPYLER